jgi:hypothetical protein
MFRAMKTEADGFPKVGRSSREIGIRIEGPIRDIPVAEDGTVEPGTGGMSVALDAAKNLPKPRLPRSLGGEGRDPVFAMLRAEVPETLLPRVGRYPHAFVEPVRRCSVLEFESDLAGTRPLWSRAHD